MKSLSAAALAVLIVSSAPLGAAAQPRGGQLRGVPAPAARPAAPAPAARPAAPARQAGGGFNIGNDFQRPNPPAPVTRPAPVMRPVQPPAGGTGNVRPPGYVRPPGLAPPPGNVRPPGLAAPPGNVRPPVRPPPGGFPQRPPRPQSGYPAPRPPHSVITNPGYHGPAWGWNGGVRWSPAGGYWGGGFWGAVALAAISAYAYGAIVDAQGQTLYSYQVAPGSPGAQLLASYQLTQTDCDQDGLVVIYGPQDSLICAYPNALVGPGNYTVDPTGLTLLSQ